MAAQVKPTHGAKSSNREINNLSAVPNAPPSGLCFAEAFKLACSYNSIWGPKRESRYSNDRFYRDLLCHFQGVRHPQDETPDKHIHGRLSWPRVGTVNALRQAALKDGYHLLSDEQLDVLVRLFLACDEGSVEKLQIEFDNIQALSIPVPLYIQPLAVLAVEQASAECVRFCISKGALFHQDIKDVLKNYHWNSAPQFNIGILDWLYDCNWDEIRTKQVFISISDCTRNGLNSFKNKLNMFAAKAILGGLSHGADILDWLLDHGARLNSHEVWLAVWSNVHEDAMARLLQINRYAAIKPPSLQAAAVNYQVGTVRLLLAAGAPPNTGKIGYQGGSDEYHDLPMSSALIEVTSPRWMRDANSAENIQKRLELARLLLEHGADVNEQGNFDWSAMNYLRAKDKYSIPDPLRELFKYYGHDPDNV